MNAQLVAAVKAAMDAIANEAEWRDMEVRVTCNATEHRIALFYNDSAGFDGDENDFELTIEQSADALHAEFDAWLANQ